MRLQSQQYYCAMTKNTFNKTLIIGLGLIGGSFAKALHQTNICQNILAYDPDIEMIDLAKNDGLISSGSDNLDILADEMSDVDLIVIATPLSAYEDILIQLSNAISPNSLIIDLGSLKGFIGSVLPKKITKNFIACHPIAGSEQNGFEHSCAELFSNKKFIICKNFENENESIAKIENLAKAIGCNVELLKHKKHDEIYALVSHLPQFLSFMMKEFSPEDIAGDFFQKAFRLDDSNPEIWSDIFEFNAHNLEKFYIELFENLETLIDHPKQLEALITNHKIDPNNAQEFTAIDKELLEVNFAEIFVRIALVSSYLKIPAIALFKDYAGSGFRDFTSIVKILDLDPELLKTLLKKNKQKILKIFNEIS